MLTRRTLFTRLSALALAPLAKWLPKRHPSLDSGVVYVAGSGIQIASGQLVEVDTTYLMTRDGVIRFIPQEES